ncbi:MAG TPA: substrate-binding domain-containing protein [Lachnospiraceae bacterium]|nr:substrate-binding domain-containing protein [Lachnospiraceae bacterium]
MEKQNKNNKENISKKDKHLSVLLLSISIIMVLVTAFSLVYFRKQVTSMNIMQDSVYDEYDRHYAFISEDQDSLFWNSVYEGAKEEGALSGVYVERLGKNLAVSYTKQELMKIAIDSHVDGIILEADESAETTALINKATDNGIPVITVLRDCSSSERRSYVGISNYNLGGEYGRQIMGLLDEDTKKILILMNMNAEDTAQNIIFTAIQETLEKEGADMEQIEIATAAISNDGPFSAEESIRDIFLDSGNLPDIMICLDELNTTSVYQAVVDFNKVGSMDIIGYYSSDTILKAIDRDIIQATISVDTNQMGQFCVNALDEYFTTGHVSEYFSVDISLITAENVKDYMISEETDEEE